MFESSVISYGNQAQGLRIVPCISFESSVISYGNQAHNACEMVQSTFESSVISYGNQAQAIKIHIATGLRVV